MPFQEEIERQGNFFFKYRGQLPILVITVGMLLFIYETITQPNIIDTSWRKWFEAACVGLSLSGQMIRFITVGFSSPRTSGRNLDSQVAESLNTKGMYSITRNPLYLGNFLMWMGLVLFIYNIWFAIVIILINKYFYERVIFVEEKFLRIKFGDTYVRWAERTPIFVPDFRKWEKNDNEFNFSKVIYKEYHGVLALFTIFFILYLIEVIFGNKTLLQEPFWAFSFLGNLTIYLLIKSYKKLIKPRLRNKANLR